MKELKPCPFCGESEDIDYGIYNGTMRGYDYVQCQNCGAEVRALHNCEWIAAEELWNRRTIEAEPTKYRWHDLRKDQYDLPIYEKPYLCVIDTMGDKYRILGRYQILNLKEFVIAWREIEPFEVEEI